MITNDIDQEEAHLAALSEQNPADLQRGILRMESYMYSYLWHAEVYSLFHEESDKKYLDNEPTIAEDPMWKQRLGDSFRRFDLTVPDGIMDLPVSWAACIHGGMFSTFWPDYPSLTLADVYGWDKVARRGSYFHFKYNHPIPHKEIYWPELGKLLVDLQMSMQCWYSI